MGDYKDEFVLVAGVGAAFLLIFVVEILEYYSLWGSLIILTCVAAYYSATFFKSDTPYQKLVFYLLMLPFIIGYFALIYRAFGIIDTSTNEIVKPDWLNATYFSVVTWTTLGYGDYKPIEELKIWVMAEALMGYVYMGLLVGKVLFISTRAANAKP
jgi:hypothetical protein